MTFDAFYQSIKNYLPEGVTLLRQSSPKGQWHIMGYMDVEADVSVTFRWDATGYTVTLSLMSLEMNLWQKGPDVGEATRLVVERWRVISEGLDAILPIVD